MRGGSSTRCTIFPLTLSVKPKRNGFSRTLELNFCVGSARDSNLKPEKAKHRPVLARNPPLCTFPWRCLKSPSGFESYSQFFLHPIKARRRNCCVHSETFGVCTPARRLSSLPPTSVVLVLCKSRSIENFRG